jgi:hypothetical protein
MESVSQSQAVCASDATLFLYNFHSKPTVTLHKSQSSSVPELPTPNCLLTLQWIYRQLMPVLYLPKQTSDLYEPRQWLGYGLDGPLFESRHTTD